MGEGLFGYDPDMTATGIELIAAERERQINELGYSAEHDAAHDDADLSFAAACYAAPTTIFLLRQTDKPSHEGHGEGGMVQWVEPWPLGWERTSRTGLADGDARIRELVKAGALIAAEIDKLQAQQ